MRISFLQMLCVLTTNRGRPARSPTIRCDLPQLSYLHIHRGTGTSPLQIPPPATSPPDRLAPQYTSPRRFFPRRFTQHTTRNRRYKRVAIHKKLRYTRVAIHALRKEGGRGGNRRGGTFRVGTSPYPIPLMFRSQLRIRALVSQQVVPFVSFHE